MQDNRSANDTSVTPGDELAARLRALRQEHPSLRVSSELIRLDEIAAVVRVEILLPAGGSMAALGASDDASVEDAENRALHRVLMALGPVEVEQSMAEAKPAVRQFPESRATDPVRPASPPVTEEPARTAPSLEEPEEVNPPIEDDAPLEDYSWTAFWLWARKIGYQNKTAVEEVIGQSITSLNPAQVRNLLRTKTGAE